MITCTYCQGRLWGHYIYILVRSYCLFVLRYDLIARRNLMMGNYNQNHPTRGLFIYVLIIFISLLTEF